MAQCLYLRLWLKGGKASSQFRWFATAKIETQFLIFFSHAGARLLRYLTNTKRHSPKNVLGNLVFIFSV